MGWTLFSYRGHERQCSIQQSGNRLISARNHQMRGCPSLWDSYWKSIFPLWATTCFLKMIHTRFDSSIRMLLVPHLHHRLHFFSRCSLDMRVRSLYICCILTQNNVLNYNTGRQVDYFSLSTTRDCCRINQSILLDLRNKLCFSISLRISNTHSHSPNNWDLCKEESNCIYYQWF